MLKTLIEEKGFVKFAGESLEKIREAIRDYKINRALNEISKTEPGSQERYDVLQKYPQPYYRSNYFNPRDYKHFVPKLASVPGAGFQELQLISRHDIYVLEVDEQYVNNMLSCLEKLVANDVQILGSKGKLKYLADTYFKLASKNRTVFDEKDLVEYLLKQETIGPLVLCSLSFGERLSEQARPYVEAISELGNLEEVVIKAKEIGLRIGQPIDVLEKLKVKFPKPEQLHRLEGLPEAVENLSRDLFDGDRIYQDVTVEKAIICEVTEYQDRIKDVLNWGAPNLIQHFDQMQEKYSQLNHEREHLERMQIKITSEQAELEKRCRNLHFYYECLREEIKTPPSDKPEQHTPV